MRSWAAEGSSGRQWSIVYSRRVTGVPFSERFGVAPYRRFEISEKVEWVEGDF